MNGLRTEIFLILEDSDNSIWQSKNNKTPTTSLYRQYTLHYRPHLLSSQSYTLTNEQILSIDHSIDTDNGMIFALVRH